jgi:uncharacterized membrane protein YGL010W
MKRDFTPISLGAPTSRMNTADSWLAAYEAERIHPATKALRWICVPVIVLGFVGLLWSLPVPRAFQQSPAVLNWGTLFLMAAMVYYFIMSISLGIGMLPFVIGVIVGVAWLDSLRTPLWALAGALFSLGWLGQLAGDWIQGRKPAFFKELMFLMIGPIWLLASVYRQLGIRY